MNIQACTLNWKILFFSLGLLRAICRSELSIGSLNYKNTHIYIITIQDFWRRNCCTIRSQVKETWGCGEENKTKRPLYLPGLVSN